MIFIIVPAYNEAGTIGKVVKELLKQGFNNVVVIDDGSTDATSQEAFHAGASIVRHQINRGQGASLQTGDEYALSCGAKLVVHFDGDGQFNPRDISLALKLIEFGQVDIVLGSRFLDGRSRLPFTKRYILLPLGRLVNYFLTGIYLSDFHNGFRILSREALAKITITQDRMAHNSEIVSYIKKYKIKYVECPVEVVYFRYGQGIGGGISIMKEWILSLFMK